MCAPSFAPSIPTLFSFVCFSLTACAAAAAAAAAAFACFCSGISGPRDCAFAVGTCRGWVDDGPQVQLVLESAELARTSLGGHSAYA